MGVVMHRDEQTTYLQAIAVPVDPHGRLNGSHYIGNRDALSRMQTEYAAAVTER